MDLLRNNRKKVHIMKKFTKTFLFILTVILIISIFPAVTTNTTEKKHKLSSPGEYTLNDISKLFITTIR